MTEHLQRILSIDPKLLGVYVVVYLAWGVLMQNVGTYTRIARFKSGWQIITCYVFYMVPVSVLLLPFAWWQQYAYGLFFMGLLEFSGYALGSSYAYDDNILDQFFGPRNFALAMTLFFAAYFPIGNAVAVAIYGVIWG